MVWWRASPGVSWRDGSRFTYTYELDGNVLWYWFGEKGSPTRSRGVIAGDGRSIAGRWNMPAEDNPDGGSSFRCLAEPWSASCWPARHTSG